MSDVTFSLISGSNIQIRSNEKINKLAHLINSTFYSDDIQLFYIEYPVLLDQKENLFSYLEFYKIDYEIDARLSKLLSNMPMFYTEVAKEDVEKDEIIQKLENGGFTRKLTDNQINNLSKICKLSCSADFSVPGAGKTTEALAYYFFHRTNPSDKLFVVSPINAFLSWDKEIKKCIDSSAEITKLRGSINSIKDKVSDSTKQFFITNYESLRNPEKYKHFEKFLLDNPNTTVVIDESHRMKGAVVSQSLKRMSSLVTKKLLLTGTPMPQGIEDLKPQFDFLYPAEKLKFGDDYLDKFQSIYVRTTKSDLGLYPINYPPPIMVKPYPAFDDFYQNYIRKPFNQGASLEEILQVSSFKLAVLKLLKVMSNPSSYLDVFASIDPKLYEGIKQEGNGAKFDILMHRIKELIKGSQKVLVWSYFTHSVDSIANELNDFNIKNVVLKGGLPSENEGASLVLEEESIDEIKTRERRILEFQEDPECKVMVANPASAAESMSLHEVCDHAIYLDRTFNAGQYLQSQDRIHRLIEKDKERKKTIEIIQLDTPGSLDFRVNERLYEKINYMGKFLEDDSLINLSEFKNPDEDDDYKELNNTGLFK